MSITLTWLVCLALSKTINVFLRSRVNQLVEAQTQALQGSFLGEQAGRRIGNTPTLRSPQHEQECSSETAVWVNSLRKQEQGMNASFKNRTSSFTFIVQKFNHFKVIWNKPWIRVKKYLKPILFQDTWKAPSFKPKLNLGNCFPSWCTRLGGAMHALYLLTVIFAIEM